MSSSALISFSVQLLTYSVRNILVAVELVPFLHVINELSQMDCQKLVVLPTVRISPTPALGVLAGAARTAQRTIHGSPVCRLPTSLLFGTELHRLLMAHTTGRRRPCSASSRLRGCVKWPKAKSDFYSQALPLPKVAGPGLKLFFNNGPVHVESRELFRKVTLCTLTYRDYDNGVIGLRPILQ